MGKVWLKAGSGHALIPSGGISPKVDYRAPWQDPADIEAKLCCSQQRFNRLYKGVWVPKGGDALDPAEIEACIHTDLGPVDALDTSPWCIGAGWLTRHCAVTSATVNSLPTAVAPAEQSLSLVFLA
jgi:hypothetical protein